MACASAALSEAPGFPWLPFAPVRPSWTTPALVTRSVGTPSVSGAAGFAVRRRRRILRHSWLGQPGGLLTLRRAALPIWPVGFRSGLQIPASDQSLRREGGFWLRGGLCAVENECRKHFVLTVAASCDAARGASHGGPARIRLREVAASSAARWGQRHGRGLAPACGCGAGSASSGAASRRCGGRCGPEKRHCFLVRAACRAGGACRGLAGASGASWQPPASRAARSRRRRERGSDRGVEGIRASSDSQGEEEALRRRQRDRYRRGGRASWRPCRGGWRDCAISPAPGARPRGGAAAMPANAGG